MGSYANGNQRFIYGFGALRAIHVSMEIFVQTGEKEKEIEKKKKRKEKLTLSQLARAYFPNTVNRRNITISSTFNSVNRSSYDSLPRKDISRQLSLQSDNTNPRIIWATIMLPVTQITQPSLQGRRVVFLDDLRVSNDGSRPGDRRPSTTDGVQEGHVGFCGMDGEIHGLAREEVRVENEVNAAMFLFDIG